MADPLAPGVVGSQRLNEAEHQREVEICQHQVNDIIHENVHSISGTVTDYISG